MEAKKDIRVGEEKKSSLILENRKRLNLSGVVEVISFDETQIVLNTNLGGLTIKGTELKMNKLDVQNGEIIIIGSIDSFVYSNTKVKQDKESILRKLFK
jgi:sporulation protein YabP